jgi:cyanophycinase-like exopeptidase
MRTGEQQVVADIGRTPVLMLIGGHEKRSAANPIFREFSRHLGPGTLLISTVASEEPEGVFESYERVFREAGVQQTLPLEICGRREAFQPAKYRWSSRRQESSSQAAISSASPIACAIHR